MPIPITGLFEPSGGPDAFNLVNWHDVAHHKWDATDPPTVNNDVNDGAEGYVVGSLWCDVTHDKAYVCLDNTNGAAVWIEITGAGGGGVTDHGALTGLADDDHTQYVLESLFDAQTILAATADNTPAAVTVAEQRIVGRKTGGNIAALTAAEMITMLAQTHMITGSFYINPQSTTVPKLIVGPMPFAGTFVKLTIKSYDVAAESAIRVDLHKQTAANEVTNTSTTVFTTQTNRPTIAAASYAGNTTTFEVSTFAKGDWLYFFLDVDDSGITVLRFGLEVTPT